jgi:rhodanese-related sulfurtransferase
MRPDHPVLVSSTVPVEEIPPLELKRRRETATPPCVLDVREPWEVAIASLPGTINIPMNELPQRLSELDPKADTVVMCKAGSRSRRVAAFLQTRGFEHVANLTGGIDAWTRDIDPGLQSY